MNKIDIDFSGNISVEKKVSWILLASGLLSIIFVGWQLIQINAQVQNAQAIRDDLHSQLVAKIEKLKKAEHEVLSGENKASIPEQNIPWDRLLKSLESAGGADVTLLELEPNAQTREVRLIGEARSLDAVISYLRRLQSAEGLQDVRIMSHQEQVDDPMHPIRFEAHANWINSIPAKLKIVN